jgi:hypothetical protein
MRRIIVSIGLGLLLSACSGRGTLNINCPPFASFTHDVPYSSLEREIHGLDQPNSQAMTTC